MAVLSSNMPGDEVRAILDEIRENYQRERKTQERKKIFDMKLGEGKKYVTLDERLEYAKYKAGLGVDF